MENIAFSGIQKKRQIKSINISVSLYRSGFCYFYKYSDTEHIKCNVIDFYYNINIF